MPSFSSNRPSLNRLVANILEKLGQLWQLGQLYRCNKASGLSRNSCRSLPRWSKASACRSPPTVAKDGQGFAQGPKLRKLRASLRKLRPWLQQVGRSPAKCSREVPWCTPRWQRYAKICEQSGKLQLKNLKTGVNVLGESMHVLELRTSRRGIQLGKFFVNASDTAGDRDSRIKSSNTQISCLTLLVNLRITHHGP